MRPIHDAGVGVVDPAAEDSCPVGPDHRVWQRDENASAGLDEPQVLFQHPQRVVHVFEDIREDQAIKARLVQRGLDSIDVEQVGADESPGASLRRGARLAVLLDAPGLPAQPLDGFAQGRTPATNVQYSAGQRQESAELAEDPFVNLFQVWIRFLIDVDHLELATFARHDGCLRTTDCIRPKVSHAHRVGSARGPPGSSVTESSSPRNQS